MIALFLVFIENTNVSLPHFNNLVNEFAMCKARKQAFQDDFSLCIELSKQLYPNVQIIDRISAVIALFVCVLTFHAFLYSCAESAL